MFIALITQAADGCDYTIACGKKWIELESKTKDEAIQELGEFIIGKPDDDYKSGFDGSFWGDERLSEVILLEVSDRIDISVEKWYSNAESILQERKLKVAQEKERAEYERLKEKFERV